MFFYGVFFLYLSLLSNFVDGDLIVPRKLRLSIEEDIEGFFVVGAVVWLYDLIGCIFMDGLIGRLFDFMFIVLY